MDRHEINGAAEQLAYILGPKPGTCALFTVQSRATGRHLTFRSECDTPEGHAGRWRIALLIGGDNQSDYQGIAVITLAGGRLALLGCSNRNFQWLWASITADLPSPTRLSQYAFLHHGQCARCGRVLTTPASIARGLGPECAQKAATA